MTILCADIIASYGHRIVVIKRLSAPLGLAFPGGKKENHEDLLACAHREFREETGLILTLQKKLSLYDTPERDDRDHVSQLFTGTARGPLKAEAGKTEILLLSKEEIRKRKDEFILDHYNMFLEYLKEN